MTETTVKPEVTPDLDTGNPDRVAHYVKKGDIVRANVEGVEVIALCGKKWIPNRDPAGLPVCRRCQAAMERIRNRRHN